MKNKIEFPTIHLNGTGYYSLMNEVDEAIKSLRHANKKVAAMTVHSRDYYIKQNYDESWRAAHAQACERLLKIDSVIRELEEYRIKIAEQKS